MLPDQVPVLGLLLHEGGWDEVLMIAAALGIAYLVIVWTGRRNQDDDEWKEDEAEESGPPEARSDQKPGQRS
jgi:hypothetical protein